MPKRKKYTNKDNPKEVKIRETLDRKISLAKQRRAAMSKKELNEERAKINKLRQRREEKWPQEKKEQIKKRKAEWASDRLSNMSEEEKLELKQRKYQISKKHYEKKIASLTPEEHKALNIRMRSTKAKTRMKMIEVLECDGFTPFNPDLAEHQNQKTEWVSAGTVYSRRNKAKRKGIPLVDKRKRSVEDPQEIRCVKRGKKRYIKKTHSNSDTQVEEQGTERESPQNVVSSIAGISQALDNEKSGELNSMQPATSSSGSILDARLLPGSPDNDVTQYILGNKNILLFSERKNLATMNHGFNGASSMPNHDFFHESSPGSNQSSLHILKQVLDSELFTCDSGVIHKIDNNHQKNQSQEKSHRELIVDPIGFVANHRFGMFSQGRKETNQDADEVNQNSYFIQDK